MVTARFDTICAPATIPGSGAISVIRVSGPECFAAVDSMVSFRRGTAAESPAGRVKFGVINAADGKLLDEVLVSLFRAPHSYTGEDCAEISCHASSYIVSEILTMLLSAGCRMALPGEFTQRAYVNGKMDLAQAEAVADVISSTTASSHRVAIQQMKGAVSGRLTQLRARLLEMASLMELELDFSEEDVEFADRSRLLSLLDETSLHIESLASSFRLGNAIKNGIPVAIVGATNAGKSTLLNSILGEQRAIVSDIAGTTRDTIEECFNIDGNLFRFIDTAGLRDDSSDLIEKIGIERSISSLKKADIVLYVLDASAPDFASLNLVLEACDFDSQSVVILVNKCDLRPEFMVNNFVIDSNNIVLSTNIESVASLYNEKKIFAVGISAKDGSGLEKLLKTLVSVQKNRMKSVDEDSVMITNLRHYNALREALKFLGLVRSGITAGSPTELLASDLRLATTTLGSITGEISSTDVLNNIFKNFCIGK